MELDEIIGFSDMDSEEQEDAVIGRHDAITSKYATYYRCEEDMLPPPPYPEPPAYIQPTWEQLYLEYDAMLEKNKLIRKQKKEAAELKKLYVYMITFTLKPGATDDIRKRAMEYIKRRTSNILFKPHKVVFCREKHQSGEYHYHVSGSYKRSIKKADFKYYSDNFGNIDFKPTVTGNQDYGIAYCTKEEDFCTLFGI